MIGDIDPRRVGSEKWGAESVGHSGLTAFIDKGKSGKRYRTISCRSNNDFNFP